MYEQYDESCDTPKPLLVAIQELGDLGKDMVATLQETGYDDGGYHGKIMLPTTFLTGKISSHNYIQAFDLYILFRKFFCCCCLFIYIWT